MLIYKPQITFFGHKDIFDILNPKIHKDLLQEYHNLLYKNVQSIFQIDIHFQSFDSKQDDNKRLAYQPILNTFWTIILDVENYKDVIKPAITQWYKNLYTMSTATQLTDTNIITEGDNTNSVIIAILLRCSSSAIQDFDNGSASYLAKKVGYSPSNFNALKKKQTTPSMLKTDALASVMGFKENLWKGQIGPDTASPSFYDKMAVVEMLRADFCQKSPEKLIVLCLNHTQSGYVEALNPLLAFGKGMVNHHRNPKPDDVYKSIDSSPEPWHNLLRKLREAITNHVILRLDLYRCHVDALLLKLSTGIDAGQKRALYRRYLVRENELCHVMRSIGMSRQEAEVRRAAIETFFEATGAAYPILTADDFARPQTWDGVDFREPSTKLEKMVLGALFPPDPPKTSPSGLDNELLPFLEVCNLLFTNLSSVLVKLGARSTPPLSITDGDDVAGIGSIALPFLQKVSQLAHKIGIPFPPGSLSAWAFCTTLHVIDILDEAHSYAKLPPSAQRSPQTSPSTQRRIKPAQLVPNGGSPNKDQPTLLSPGEIIPASSSSTCGMSEESYLKDKANLLCYARQCLEEIGEVCGLMPDNPSTPEYSSAAVALLSGLGFYVDPTYTPLSKLRHCLESKEYFKTFYMELSEFSLVGLKQIGRARSARLVGRNISQFYMRMGEYDMAETLCQDFLRCLEFEGWPLMATHSLKELLQCRLRKLQKMSHQTEKICEGSEVRPDDSSLIQTKGYKMAKLIPIYLALATSPYLGGEERIEYTRNIASTINEHCAANTPSVKLDMSLLGRLVWIGTNFGIDRDIVGSSVGDQDVTWSEGGGVPIDLTFGFDSQLPTELVRIAVRLVYGKDCQGTTKEPNVSERSDTKSGSGRFYLSAPDLQRKRGPCVDLALTEYKLTRFKEGCVAGETAAPSQHIVLGDSYGIRCGNKTDVISSLYSPPTLHRSIRNPNVTNNSLYTFDIPGHVVAQSVATDDDGSRYLETGEFNLLPRYNEYSVRFTANNDTSYTFTGIQFVLGPPSDPVISFGTDLPSSLSSLRIAMTRPTLYFELGDSEGAPFLANIHPGRPSLSPSGQSARTATANGPTRDQPRSNGLKVKPLADVEQTWAFVLDTGDFSIPPGSEIGFGTTQGLVIGVTLTPCLDSDKEGSLIRFVSVAPQKYSLTILRLIGACHTLTIPCQFLANTSKQGNEHEEIRKKGNKKGGFTKPCPYTFDHKIEIHCPWERSAITQNLRFYQPFTVGHTLHTYGTDQKYIQIVVKCRTNEATFRLYKPQLKYLTGDTDNSSRQPPQTSGCCSPVSLTKLNGDGEVLEITGNQSASFVWLLTLRPQGFDTEAMGERKHPNGIFNLKSVKAHPINTRDLPNSNGRDKISDQGGLDFTFTLHYNKSGASDPPGDQISPIKNSTDSVYTYSFDCVNIGTVFTVNTTLIPEENIPTAPLGTDVEIKEGDYPFLKVGNPCTYRVQIQNVGFDPSSPHYDSIFLKCRLECDPAIWALADSKPKWDDDDNIISIGAIRGSLATYQRRLIPVTRGYFPPPTLRLLYKMDDEYDDEEGDATLGGTTPRPSTQALSPEPATPTKSTTTTKVVTKNGVGNGHDSTIVAYAFAELPPSVPLTSSHLSSLYQKCSSPFKGGSAGFGSKTNKTPPKHNKSDKVSVKMKIHANGNSGTGSHVGKDIQGAAKRDSTNGHRNSKGLGFKALGHAQVYHASLGTQYQVLPPSPVVQ